MELMQSRLQDLTKRCNKFHAKYANKPDDTGLVGDIMALPSGADPVVDLSFMKIPNETVLSLVCMQAGPL